AVSTVINMTREYSHYLVDVWVAYDQDTDAVVAVLREVDAELRGDTTYADAILAPIDVLGLDRFEETAVVVRVRLTTKPLMQWTVGREFNRRLKVRLAAHHIAPPLGQRPVFVTAVPAPGASSQAEAPPMQERG
ncbi:MAG: mechanosensitive ion channel family protein, partial [Alphaproteobacteria bacterium]|nr:mechanosensitive ion channel family protein [Alphaproteobacteria bacterium]